MDKDHPNYKNIELVTEVVIGKAYFNLKLEVIEKIITFL